MVSSVQKLTLKGYLSDYVRYLSGLDTNNMIRLAKEAQTNYRLREPLFIYAYWTNKIDLLLNSTKGTELGDKFSSIYSDFSFQKFLDALETKSNVLDERYHKCYNSYICKRDMTKTYDRKKQLMHNKIKNLQSTKSVTAYRIYSDLNLNGANTKAFLKHGDVKKLSLDAVRNILQYLEEK